MNRIILAAACLWGLLVPVARLEAQTEAQPEEDTAATNAISTDVSEEKEREETTEKKPSPWLGVPLLATSPKMGTSVGALGAYLHYFDPQSQVSMFGAMAEYTNTDSMVGGLFARTSFGADHHRVEGLVGFGYVKNEYSDYLGTGQPFKTTDDIRLIAGRYYLRVQGNWFVGGQVAFANYQVSGVTELDDLILDALGVTGVRTGGIGIVGMYDSRDNQDMPTKGWYANLNNIANREWLGADSDYDAVRLEFKWFFEHGNGHVFAIREFNQLTYDAPLAAEASIQLRGYKMGQYLGKYMSSLELEERLRFSRRWGATIFAGVGCLYGGEESCSNSDDVYPTYGGGVHYVLKPEDRQLVNLEYAYGDADNNGVYLTYGYSW